MPPLRPLQGHTRDGTHINPVALPLCGEFMFGMSVPLIGLYLASQASDAAAGSFGLGQQVLETLVVLFRVLAIGGGILVTRLLGSGNAVAVRETTFAALGASTWFGLAAAAWLLLANELTLDLLNAPPQTWDAAARFLWLLAPALWLEAYNLSMAATLRAHLHARTSLRIMAAMHGCHLLLALVLMPGIGSWSGWGIDGYAIAMLISRALGLALHLAFWRWRLGLRPRTAHWWRIQPQRLWPMLRIGLPGGALEMVYRLAFMVSLAATARLGVGALATHAYTLQVLRYVLVPSLSIGRGIEILVGRLVGAGRLRTADAVVRKATRNALLLSAGLALLAALSAPWLMPVFSRDPQILAQAQALLWLSIGLELGRAGNLAVVPALRASGDSDFPAWASMVSMVLVLGLGSHLLGPRWGLTGIWLAYVADECLRGWVMWLRWRRLGWLPHARHTLRQLAPPRTRTRPHP